MGIGFALASGLVQGFTQNIGREMERRQGERERLDALSTALITAGVGDDFNNKNIGVIQDYVQRGYQNLDAQGGIDLFGTRGANVITEEDVTGLLGQLETTAKPDDEYEYDPDSVISYNGVTYYQFPTAIKAPTSLATAAANITNLNVALQQDMDKFDDLPDQVKDELKQLAQLNGSVFATELFGDRPQGAGLPDLGQYGYMVQLSQSLSEKLGLTDNIIGTKLTGKIPGAESAVPDVDDTGTGMTVNVIPKAEDPAEQAVMDALYEAFGIKPGDTNAFNQRYYRYAKIIPQNKRLNLFNTAMEWAVENDITTDFFDATTMATLAMDEVRSTNVLDSLRSKTESVQEMALILGMFHKPQFFRKTERVGDKGEIPGTRPSDEPFFTAELYAAKVNFGLEATGKDMQEIVKTQEAMDKVLSDEIGLGRLLDVSQSFETAPVVYKFAKGLATVKDIFGFFIGSERDASANVYTSLTSDVVVSNYRNTVVIDDETDQALLASAYEEGYVERARLEEDFMTTSYLARLDARIQQARKNGEAAHERRVRNGTDGGMTMQEMGNMYAEFESLRISLAFAMARAADPSGRLSNQDVDQMLQRLSGNLDTPAAMEVKIQTAIKEFEFQRDRYSLIAPFAGSTSEATYVDKLRIHGAHALNELSKAAGYVGAGSLQRDMKEASTPVFTPDDLGGSVMYGGNKYLPKGNGEWMDDEFMPVEDKEIIDMLNRGDLMPEMPITYLPNTGKNI